MNRLNYYSIMEVANSRYAYAKKGDDMYYMAPEIRPKIESDQVKVAIEALVDAINIILDSMVEAADFEVAFAEMRD